MGSARRRFDIGDNYHAEALSRLRAGKPVSQTLRDARAIVAQRGWSPPSGDDYDLDTRGAVDVETAIQIAAGADLDLLRLGDAYAWFTPIESVLRCTIVKWERQPGLVTRDVLAAMDEAIEFALEAERVPGGLLEGVATPSLSS